MARGERIKRLTSYEEATNYTSKAFANRRSGKRLWVSSIFSCFICFRCMCFSGPWAQEYSSKVTATIFQNVACDGAPRLSVACCYLIGPSHRLGLSPHGL